jgi:hypothetical protein
VQTVRSQSRRCSNSRCQPTVPAPYALRENASVGVSGICIPAVLQSKCLPALLAVERLVGRTRSGGTVRNAKSIAPTFFCARCKVIHGVKKAPSDRRHCGKDRAPRLFVRHDDLRPTQRSSTSRRGVELFQISRSQAQTSGAAPRRLFESLAATEPGGPACRRSRQDRRARLRIVPCSSEHGRRQDLHLDRERGRRRRRRFVAPNGMGAG